MVAILTGRNRLSPVHDSCLIRAMSAAAVAAVSALGEKSGCEDTETGDRIEVGRAAFVDRLVVLGKNDVVQPVSRREPRYERSADAIGSKRYLSHAFAHRSSDVGNIRLNSLTSLRIRLM